MASAERRTGPSARWAASELILGFLLFELDVWFVRGVSERIHLVVVGCGAVLLMHSLSRDERLRSLVRFGGRRAWMETLVVTGALAVGVVVAGTLVTEPSGEPSASAIVSELAIDPVRRLGIAVGQQLALQLFLWPNCLELLGPPFAAGIAAVGLFAAAHLPTPGLVLFSAGGSAAWVALFYRHGLIPPLIVSHLVLSAAVQASLPETLHGGMQVGRAALR